MNVSGFELIQPIQSVLCHNGFCGSIFPLCFAGISPNCARNRASSKWHHFSFGEHVCEACFDFLSPKQKGHPNTSVWRHRLNAWKKGWIQKCSPCGRVRSPTTSDFLAAHFLPWWLKCCLCGSWRQLPPHSPIGDPNFICHPLKFSCSAVNKLCETPCSWPLDERTTLVMDRPHDFLGSMTVHSWPQSAPGASTLSAYGIDLVGLSPDRVPGLLGEGEGENGTKASFAFKPDGANLFSPIDMQSWERLCFPEMARFSTMYLAVRNMILYLWSADPQRLLTTWIVSSHLFLRGLLRIVICEQWIPRILDEFTTRGLINIGACQMISNSDAAPQAIQSANQLAVPMLSVQVYGDLDLRNAVTVRQLRNGLTVRSRPDNPSYHAPPVELHFRPLTGRSQNSLAEDPLLELHLDCQQPHPDQLVTDRLDNPAYTFKAAVPSQNLAEEDSEHRLVLPSHAWTDRVHLYDNHPLLSLVAQSDLTLRPLSSGLLLYTDTTDSPVKIIPVPEEKRVRMEFHVEAVLDMVAQPGDRDSDAFDQQCLARSVQDSWDSLNASVRERLHDLDESSLEKSLIEFYLGAVELDLTEPLTVNFTHASVHSCPTACLDQLPTDRYVEFLIDPTSSCETPATASGCLAHRIVNRNPHRSVFGQMCHTLVDHETVNSDDLSDIASICVSIVPDKETSDPSAQSATPYMHLSEVPVSTPVDNPFRSVKLVVRSVGGEEKAVDWAVLLSPISTLRFAFEDSNPSALPASKFLGMDGCSMITIQLPVAFRYLLVQDAVHQVNGLDQSSDGVICGINEFPARLITVTLVYREPWWRTPLVNLNAQHTDNVDADDSIHQFSFLPSDRENRGFCHVFRDTFPEIQSPGVIQTQIFAKAANRLWSSSDAALSSSVHEHLCSSFGQLTPDTAARDLLSYYVARSQHPVDSKPDLHVIDENNQPLRLKPDCWEQLAKCCHILIPRMISSASEEVTPFSKMASETQRPILADSCGMDVVTTAVLSGLRLAEVALRHIDCRCPPDPTMCQTVHDTSMVDSSNCVEEFTDLDASDAHSDPWANHPGECTKRTSKRKLAADDDDDDVSADSSAISAH